MKDRESKLQKAWKVLATIKEKACTDSTACKEHGLGAYDFWALRKEEPELIKEYNLASEWRAQMFLERADEVLLAAESDIRCEDFRLASPLVTLARNRAAHLRQYAALTDKKRWGDTKTDFTIALSAKADDQEIKEALKKGQQAREEIERLREQQLAFIERNEEKE